jgi:hypothetical protein
MPLLSEQPILNIRAELAPILKAGVTPHGERRVINILGGTVEGPKFKGRILPGGADWQLIRSDGVAEIGARYVIETDTGAHVLVDNSGLRHGPPEVMARLARDESVDPSQYYFRTLIRFETADPASAWLNRILGLCRGTREARAVRLEVYEVL